MPSETAMLLQSIRQWVLVAVFLLGVGLLTLAHLGWIQNSTSLLYWQSLVFSVAGVIGGFVATVSGLKILGSLSNSTSGGLSTK